MENGGSPDLTSRPSLSFSGKSGTKFAKNLNFHEAPANLTKDRAEGGCGVLASASGDREYFCAPEPVVCDSLQWFTLQYFKESRLAIDT